MSVRARVVQTWPRLTKHPRPILRNQSLRSADGVGRFRGQILMGSVQGRTPSQLAAGGLCAGSQVDRLAHRFLDEGLRGIADRRQDNGQPKVHARYASQLLAVVAGSPQEHGYRRPTWTQELLILVLAQRTGLTIRLATRSRLLKRLKVRLGRPKPIVECPWEKARRDRRWRRIKPLVRDAGPDEVVLDLDEVDIQLNPKVGLDGRLPGQQEETLTPGQDQTRYLAGALDARRGRLTWVEGPRQTGLLFRQRLYRLVRRTYRAARVIDVILDNYGIHVRHQVRLAMATVQGRMKLHFLPPYGPRHNRIERVWEDWHADVTRNHRCRTREQLREQVRLDLKTRNRRRRHAYPRAKAA